MFENLKQDLARYGGARAQLRALILTPGAWVVVGYRFGRWVYTTRSPWPLRPLLNAGASLVKLWVEMTTSIDLPAQAEIGPGLLIAHTGYVVVASGVVLGRYCTLTQGVTIGHASGGTDLTFSCPVIGDRVYLGPGAAVIGDVNIGDDALIGVNAVVTRSVPPRGVAVGNPARVISRQGSFKLISYTGMEHDPGRLAALDEKAGTRSTEETAAVR